MITGPASGVCGHSHSRQLAAPMPAASAARSTTVAAISMPFVCDLYRTVNV
jgi:hypothetical protein